MEDLNFDLIRPYNFDEVLEAIPRILKSPDFHAMMGYLFTDDEKASVIDNIKRAGSIHDFQIALTLPAVESIVKKTTDGLTASGFENIENDKGVIFLASHRDIVLDSSMLGALLYRNGFNTPQVTWGNNLMVTPLIVDLGRSNQMITVFREGSPKEMLINSQRLSAYIRNTITNNHKPVWIAHRKGRSKDGFDKTDVSILKMLSLSGNTSIQDNLSELNLTPTTISYEWEPCDAMKVREIYLSRGHKYIKSDDEDFHSIIHGLTGDKGRVHISIGHPISNDVIALDKNGNNNEFLGLVCELVDRQIYKNYRLWPSNYLAYDILNNTSGYSNEYDNGTRKKFEQRYENTARLIGENNTSIRELFLLLYANPLINKLKNDK